MVYDSLGSRAAEEGEGKPRSIRALTREARLNVQGIKTLFKIEAHPAAQIDSSLAFTTR